MKKILAALFVVNFFPVACVFITISVEYPKYSLIASYGIGWLINIFIAGFGAMVYLVDYLWNSK